MLLVNKFVSHNNKWNQGRSRSIKRTSFTERFASFVFFVSSQLPGQFRGFSWLHGNKSICWLAVDMVYTEWWFYKCHFGLILFILHILNCTFKATKEHRLQFFTKLFCTCTLCLTCVARCLACVACDSKCVLFIWSGSYFRQKLQKSANWTVVFWKTKLEWEKWTNAYLYELISCLRCCVAWKSVRTWRPGWPGHRGQSPW